MREKVWDFLETVDECHTIDFAAQRFEVGTRVETTCANNGFGSCIFCCKGIVTEVPDDQSLLSTYLVLFHEFSEDFRLVARISDNACEEVVEVVVCQFFLEDVLGATADQMLLLYDLCRFLERMSCVGEEIRLVDPLFYSTPENTIELLIGDMRWHAVSLVEFHVIMGDLTAIDLERRTGEAEVSEDPPYTSFINVCCIILERSVPVPDGKTNLLHDRGS